MNSQQPKRRRSASHRRDLLAAAGEQVIAERGVDGLTHRAVAEAAQVPLGSTTYYFADREDLLAAVLHRAVDGYTDYLDRWAAEHADDTLEQVVRYLIDIVLACVTEQRGQSIVEFELCLAAARRPELQSAADRFNEAAVSALAPRFTDRITAVVASSTMSGYILHGLVRGTPPDRAEVTAVMYRVFGLPQPG
ncbi:TetR/AcrR family transcriptional regulator [Nocardia brasiliensis]|uniref:HTH tetR-type domain-containing protein n=1 Tax=Nocardia brasiliensis (strain ATCC 700358 / HUJEG-1) TaxID=1133849 RepID=K0ES66_NOCB7|nr:TetR family transcriptional regulator [Nocardia brasiliensis]AFT99664.1 hypothetical protein O3I_008510 [Nocardia brasiliensis ATCC 700358]OCF90598.1 hypothetical protein AW168_11635 [Nocardia brasiliensis]